MNTKENRIALIPARLESQRLPEKLLLSLGDLPIIVRTYQAVLKSGLFDKVVVICNHSSLAAVLDQYNCEYIFNETHFESGTDRIANELGQFPYEIIVNVQGDEPFIKKNQLKYLVEQFDNKEVEIATLKHKLVDVQDIENPNFVKVVCNEKGRALYFSRSPIPFNRDESKHFACYKHIGVYAYKHSVLLQLSQMQPSKLELCEKLENLRMIEYGFYVSVAEVDEPQIAIDTIEDYRQAVQFFESGDR